MKLNIHKDDFLQEVRTGGIPPLYAEIPYGEPHLIYEALCRQKQTLQNSVLLESVKGPHKIARYSFISYEPYLILAAGNRELSVYSPAAEKSSVSYRPPLERLEELITAYPQKHIHDLPPFQGGAVGLLSYDFVRYIEDIPKNAADDLNIPDAHFMLVDRVVAFDHRQNRAWALVAPGVRSTELGYRGVADIDWDKAYDEAAETVLEICDKLRVAGCEFNPPSPPFRKGGQGGITDASRITHHASLNYEMSGGQYRDIVKRAKEYIAAGDIFQANLSQRISSHIGGKDPWEIYKVLRTINPSPFAAYLDFGSYQIAGSSPERLVKVRGNAI